jgi:PspA-Associated protein
VIVRILGEGQYDLAEEALSALNDLDAEVERAVESDDEEGFRAALAALLDAVRTAGVAHDADSLEPSDVILPMPDATLAEVRDLLSGDGLVPG